MKMEFEVKVFGGGIVWWFVVSFGEFLEEGVMLLFFELMEDDDE